MKESKFVNVVGMNPAKFEEAVNGLQEDAKKLIESGVHPDDIYLVVIQEASLIDKTKSYLQSMRQEKPTGFHFVRVMEHKVRDKKAW
jgi:Tat protein secretion system quality control protein TatD with DNase activity